MYHLIERRKTCHKEISRLTQISRNVKQNILRKDTRNAALATKKPRNVPGPLLTSRTAAARKADPAERVIPINNLA